ncbi:TPA: copper homeostasis periplasmic binding protein CopC [Pseudomonas aeruginosa]
MIQSAKRFLVIATLGASLLGAGQAFAHAHLKGEVPAADSSVAAPKELRLTFSEGVEAKFTKVSVNGPDGKQVEVTSIASAPGDDKVLVVTLGGTLAAGEYQVQWHAVSVDTHKSDGKYAFKVTP